MAHYPVRHPAMAHNQAHADLITFALRELAKAGYCAWSNPTGVWFERDEQHPEERGRPHKYGKTGSGDIFCVLPPHGRHAEFEGKVGKDTQRESQAKHQKYVVERNGGLYILFRSAQELISELKRIGY